LYRGGAPLFFGRLPGRAASKPAERLKVGIVYEVSGSAACGNYFRGMFRIARMVGYRAEDVAGSRSMTLAEDVKTLGVMLDDYAIILRGATTSHAATTE
jgi:hypothetical protein